jgi:hypothetical protein
MEGAKPALGETAPEFPVFGAMIDCRRMQGKCER